MRKLLLHGATALIITIGAAHAQAPPAVGQASPAALTIQMQEPTPAVWSANQSSSSAAENDAQATVRSGDRTGSSIAKDLWSLVRTSALLGLASVVIGLSSVGVRSLWVADQTEYPAHDIMDYRSAASPATRPCDG